jgi:hypothetical protein
MNGWRYISGHELELLLEMRAMMSVFIHQFPSALQGTSFAQGSKSKKKK